MLELKPVLVIFTRLPEKERVKTRLTPPLSPEEAVRLQRAMVLDALALAKDLEEYSMAVAYAPGAEKALLKSLKKQAVLIPQRGESLGDRMANALQDVFDMGFTPGVLLGTDIPTLPPYIPLDALEELKRKEVVLGPTLDGGYYLIGMRSIIRRIFRGISWGTPEVLTQSIARIKGAGLSFSCLEAWYDVDTPEDLAFLRLHVEALREAGVAWPKSTSRVLRGLGL